MYIVIFARVCRQINKWVPRQYVSTVIANGFPDRKDIENDRLPDCKSSYRDSKSEGGEVDHQALDRMCVYGPISIYNVQAVVDRVDMS